MAINYDLNAPVEIPVRFHPWYRGWFTLRGRRHRVSYFFASFVTIFVGSSFLSGAITYWSLAREHHTLLSPVEASVLALVAVASSIWLVVTWVSLVTQRTHDIGWSPAMTIFGWLSLTVLVMSFPDGHIVAQAAGAASAVLGLFVLFMPPSGEEFIKIG